MNEETVFGAPYTCPHCGKTARGQCTCIADGMGYVDVKKTIPDFKLLLITFLKWYDDLSPASKVSVWSKDGSTTGLFTMDEEQLVDKFCSLEPNIVKDLVGAIFDAGRAKTFTAVTDDGFNHFVYTYNKGDYLKQLGL